MIVEILIKFCQLLLFIFDRLLPNWSLPDEYISAFSSFSVGILKWDGIIPLQAILYVIIAILTFEGLMLMYKAITGLVSLIRGGGNMDI